MNTDNSVQHYINEYQQVAGQLTGHDLPWLQQLRQAAQDNLIKQGFPTTHCEEWKYTSVKSITKHAFKIANSQANDIDISQLVNSALIQHCMVFINGHFNAQLSKLNQLPKSINIKSLKQALKEDSESVKTHLNQLAANTQQGFSDLNTLLMNDGAYIHLKSNSQLEHPIFLLFINTQENTIIPVRNLIIADENSQATIIENFISLSSNNYLTSTITELFANAKSKITHYKLLQENEKAFHIGSLEVKQLTNSEFTSHSFALDGLLTRSDINVELAEQHVACTLNGLYFAQGKQHIDHHTKIKHSHPHGTSRQYYKGVLSDHSRAVFNGKVFVQPGAMKTDAQQTNKNLLLSLDAEIDTKPELEIYADDVKCTHGAAIGQLDANALFYLKSRGIAEAQAKSILIYAFIEELVEHVSIAPLRQQLEQNLRKLHEQTTL